MKTSEADILMLPGAGPIDPGHWLARWESRLPTARRIAGVDETQPDLAGWSAAVVEAVAAATRPVVLVAHSLGVLAVVGAAAALRPGAVRGAFLVAPDHVPEADIPDAVRQSFGRPPAAPLPFPAMLIASRNDPACPYGVADEMAADWGALLIDAGESGHIDTASGHGPWPEGLTRFATLLSRI